MVKIVIKFARRHIKPIQMAPEDVSPLFFVIFGVLLLLIAISRLTNIGYFRELFEALWNPTLTQHLKEEGKLGANLFQIPIDISLIGALSFFCMLIIEQFTLESFRNLFLLIGIFYLSQVVLILIFSRLFFGESYKGGHEAEFINFNRCLGVLFTPIVLILFYAPIPFEDSIMRIVISLLFLFLVGRFFRTFLTLAKQLHHGRFYIFLYLCALEIAPVLLFMRAILL